jgi:hypothetical protein
VADTSKVVIAESGTDAPGMFRFVLEGEGLEILAETNTVPDLVAAMAVHRPDVVVISEQTGLEAIAYVRAVSEAKVVLVSNDGAHAGAADAQGESSAVISELGPVIEELCGSGTPSVTRSFERPAWIDRVRKDPKTLRDILSKSRRSASAGQNVTELQSASTTMRLNSSEGSSRPEPTTAAHVEDSVAEVLVLPTAVPDRTPLVVEDPDPIEVRLPANDERRSDAPATLHHPHKS